ncbi:MAG TPA: response regulator [Pyrinomonadaceae bacterium]|jgi:CheY-like chemotaxis protein|nr:response regulator [Pyrinomonadaceae bacterium]
MSTSPKVLVVEDEPLSAKTLLLMLRSNNYDAVHASFVDQARAILNDSEDLMLVIMDLWLPVTESDASEKKPTMNAGLALAEEIDGDHRNLPIKFITGYTEFVNISSLEAIKNFDGFHTKPLSTHDILDNVQQAFKRWKPATKGLASGK